MNVLLVNPPEYGFVGFHNIHTYPTDLYNQATHYKCEGYDVDMFDMYPELANSALITSVGGEMCYGNIPVIENVGIAKKCGNYENEGLVKGVIKTGLPMSMLKDKMKSKKYDKISVCVMGSKTGVSSGSWIYSFMGAYEVINMCKEIQPESKIELIGASVKLCSLVARASLADISVDIPTPVRHFMDTDISLFQFELPTRINIATSYGCANECKYCFVPITEGSSRKEKPVEDVLSYMEQLVSSGCNKFRILDSNILVNWDKHMKKILTGIVNSKWDISLTSYGGIEPSLLTDEVGSLMAEAGFNEINVPLDNSDPEILKLWGGIKTVDSWKRAADIATKHFNKVRSYIMIAYPGQTYDNVTKSINMCKEKGIAPSLLPYTPIPGTIYEDNTRHPEELHPLLFPYASQELTVAQIEEALKSNSLWYKKSTIRPTDIFMNKRIYVSTPAIPKMDKKQITGDIDG